MTKRRATGNTTAPIREPHPKDRAGGKGACFGLAVALIPDEPYRIGEVALFAQDARPMWILGRPDGEDEGWVELFRQRPGVLEPTPPIRSRGVSRRPVEIRVLAIGLAVRRLGRRRMFINGRECDSGILTPGDTLLIEGQLLMICIRRPLEMPRCKHVPQETIRAFGEADGLLIIGESFEAWELRNLIAKIAKAPVHVLIGGESGTGKELTAKGLHALSDRRSKPFVGRSGATFASSVVEGEIFGIEKSFLGVGNEERPGLVGRAEGGFLFLDEIGELSHDLQARLLRLLDPGGEYNRVGDGPTRHADIRFVGATNRNVDEMKSDVAARLKVRIVVPPLAARREDIPLLVRHLVLEMARRSPDNAARFVDTVGGRQEVRIDLHFMDSLVRDSHPMNVRGLEKVLWRAVLEEEEGTILMAPKGYAVAAPPEAPGPPADPEEESDDEGVTEELLLGLGAAEEGPLPSKKRILACLERNSWRRIETAAELGLSSRFVLERLMQKYGIKKPGK